MVSPPASRNALCPCGSGKRYKDCHGALGKSAANTVSPDTSPVEAFLDRARSALASGDRADAESLWRQALAIDPDNAEWQCIQGVLAGAQAGLAADPHLDRLDNEESRRGLAGSGDGVSPRGRAIQPSPNSPNSDGSKYRPAAERAAVGRRS